VKAISSNLSLRLAHQDFDAIRIGLFTDDGCENFAVCFCGIAAAKDGLRLLVRESWIAPTEAYEERSAHHLRIAPRFFNSVVGHGLATHLSPLLVHSHPNAPKARYSPSDDFGETRLLEVLQQLLPSQRPASILFSADEVTGRRLIDGVFQPLERIDVTGTRHISFRRDEAVQPARDREFFDRQVRIFGDRGQTVIAGLRIAVVGVGGTGSAVAEQIARLGVDDILLVDPDALERSNLSRMWGTRDTDLQGHTLKVDAIARHLQSIWPKANVRRIAKSVIRQPVLKALTDRDMVFACTDNDLSRAILNRFAHQYLIPVVDMGIRLDARAGQVSAAAGRVTIAGTGFACLRCSNHLDAERVRVESLPLAERTALDAEGYIQGLNDPAPAVISLNTTVASLAVTAGIGSFVNLVGTPPAVDQIYDATSGSIFTVKTAHEPSCEVCSEKGLKGLGDLKAVSAYE